MSKFNPSSKKLVVNELIEKGYIPDYDDALRLCHELEEEEQTDHKVAIGLTAVGIVGAGVTLAFCGAVAPLLVPIAAIGVGISGVWNHPIRATRRDDEADFLRANPSIIPLIEARLQSGEADFKVSAAYLECFRAWRNTGQPLALPSVNNQDAPIGTVTKFGAVEVPSSTAAQTSVQSAKPFDVTYDLGTNPQSALIAGVPGAGKGMIASNAIRHMKAKRPELTVMVIDPKADEKESGYWEGIANVVERLAFAENDPDDCATWLLLKIKQYQSLPTPKLLVMDEGAVIVQFLKLAHKDIKAMGRLKAFIAHISSMGDSSESWLWFITQMVNVDDLGISGGFRSIFRAIAVVAPKNINAVNAFLATTFVPMPSGGMEEIMSLMKQSPVNRAFYDGKSNQWYLMPELENHSGYDRDSRTYLKGESPQVQRQEVSPRASLEKLFQETQSLPATAEQSDEETDFDRLMRWFESHPTLTPTIAELKSVHKFKLKGDIELEDLLDAARQMQILRCQSNGKANRYHWLGEHSLDNLET